MIREVKVKTCSFVIISILLLVSCGANLPSDVDLFTQAQEHEGRQEYNDALKRYELIIEKYPESELRYKALFMKGFILFDNLKDNKRAIDTFDLLLSQYPDCDLADDATVLRQIAAEDGDIMSTFEDSLNLNNGGN
jgi:outer membrane protein assembly factor BamD (BamD/ComL family)